jgi:hypothetical protein
MDTDGCVYKNGEVEFSTSSEQLSIDFLKLVRSLGIICKCYKKKTTHLPSYRIKLYTRAEIFKLRRKIDRLRKYDSPSFEKTALVDIKESSTEDSICISVDNPSKLFIASEQYIPTHNTYMVGVGIVLHQWLFNGVTSLTEDISDRGVADITVGAELAHYSNNMLVKTKFALENLPGTKTVNGRRYPSPFDQQYKGSWGPGNTITAEYKAKQEGGWENKGTKATIRHRTFRDNPFADQGTRPITIIVEEAGHCSNLQDIFTNTKDNLRNGLRKTGTLMMLGTGGDMESGTLDASTMMYEPEAYDLVSFEDTWENKGNIGLFVPAYLALNEYKDEQGFSKIEEAKSALLKARQRAKTSASGGSEVLNKEIQYRPIVPSEMFLTKSANIFPVTEARRRLSELQTNNLSELLEKKINLFFDPKSPYNGVNYEIDFKLNPINKFPWTSDEVEGAIIMYELPYLEGNVVPQDAYIIGCDPFRDNTGMGSSFAAIYVMKTNKYPSTVGHNEIVATYVGRPYQGVNAINEMLYKLSLFYGNAKIYFENAVGNVKDYFEKIKRLDLLAKQPVNVLNRKASFNTTESVIYGYPMSNDKIKWEALQYVRSWLLQERQNGVRNIDVIPDKFLLQQLISFNLDGNFDAVMGLIGCVIGLEEIYISSKRRAESETFTSALDQEINKLFTNNQRLFYTKNEKFSKTEVVLPGEGER